jgi:hypothetical protein
MQNNIIQLFEMIETHPLFLFKVMENNHGYRKLQINFDYDSHNVKLKINCNPWLGTDFPSIEITNKNDKESLFIFKSGKPDSMLHYSPYTPQYTVEMNEKKLDEDTIAIIFESFSINQLVPKLITELNDNKNTYFASKGKELKLFKNNSIWENIKEIRNKLNLNKDDEVKKNKFNN